MATLVVRLADLEFLTPEQLRTGLSHDEIADAVRKQFGYLPGTLQVEVNDGLATIQFAEASAQNQTEARRLTTEKVREITFEAGMAGQHGLDYADAEPKCKLQSLPGEKFSGLQLTCLLFAGFKRIAPDRDLGMDLEEPFLQALEIHQQREGGG